MTKPALHSLDHYQEMLSALADGELAETEVNILLQAIEHYPQLRSHWLSFQKIRAAVHKELPLQQINALSFADKVSEAIVDIQHLESPMYAIPAELSQQKPAHENKVLSLLVPMKAFAVAATVMLVIVFSWLVNENRNEIKQMVFNKHAENRLADVNESMVQIRNQKQQAQKRYGVLASSPDGINANTMQTSHQRQIYLSNKRIENYMLFHAENASLNVNEGMLPFARMSRLSSDHRF